MSDSDHPLQELIERHAEGELTIRQVSERAGIDYYEALEAIGEYHRQQYNSKWVVSPEELREGEFDTLDDLQKAINGRVSEAAHHSENIKRGTECDDETEECRTGGEATQMKEDEFGMGDDELRRELAKIEFGLQPSDLNERVKEEWKADTTPTERVRSVMKRLYEPRSLSIIAEQALVSEELARMHLNSLAEDEFVIKVEENSGETRYRRSSESVIRERVEQIRDSTDADTLEERVAELREAVREYRQCDEMSSEKMIEWRTALRNLALAETALEFTERVPIDGESSRIPEGVVRAIEQINRGESVAKEDVIDGLNDLSDSDAGN